tara:strand:- start:1354 stop:1560 length:207 start_codon:yes stop_codon:yes gene_type:complete
MQVNLRNAGPGAGIGCGGLVALVGLILVSPVGEWLIKGIGWILIVMGVVIAVTGVWYWMKRPKNDRYL